MMVIRKIAILVLLLLATSFVQSASATLQTILPESSHYQGHTFYAINLGTDRLYGRIDFAVYDTANLQLAGEIAFADKLGMPGQFIYAYQIFNDYEGLSDEAVTYFAVFGSTGAAMDVYADSIGAENDSPDDPGNAGIEPTSAYFAESNSRGVWEFYAGENLAEGKHSWFLVFSSNRDWVAGEYEIKTGNPTPVPPVPEPCTMVLFGIGGVIMFIKRRRFAR